ncbi:MAG: GNAT family N-acetyltransferase [Dyella sp.]|uniref:GNAT family N-acetyltransferase n=1 Tax=Dyella sp. TaxID=1869338 RepID=UPI003F805D7D
MNAFPPINLACDRFSLRLLETHDAADLLAIFGDAEVVRYWSQPPWRGEEDALAMLERDRESFVDGQALRLGIVLRSTGRVVGTLSVFNFSRANRRAEIGYALARVHWGQGLMHEALGLLLGWAFDTLQLHRLEADIDPANEASARSLQRLGFQREGLLRERWIVDGQVSDTVFYGLLAAEWRAARSA